MKLDMLFEHAGDLGVEIEWHDLGERRGDYNERRKVIRLHRGLTRNQIVDVFSHEVGHAVFGDESTAPCIERRASEYGASLVIEPDEYAAAERMVGPHAGALAVELGVTRHLIEAWRRWYLRRRPAERMATAMATEGAESVL